MLTPKMSSLFDQLGLPSDEESIGRFVTEHYPLDNDKPLPEAPWWTPSQADFLQQALQEDSVWAEVADELNVLLRESSPMNH